MGGGLRHVGRAPGVLNKKTRAANAILQAGAEEVARKVLDTATNDFRVVRRNDGTVIEQRCPLCGVGGQLRDEEIQLKARLGLLDRTGNGPSSKVEVSEAPDESWMDYATDEELTQFLAIAEAARARMPE